MKRFIIATVIFMVVAIISIATDAFFMLSWEAMPNLIYYSFGWFAAGIYIAISNKISKNKK